MRHVPSIILTVDSEGLHSYGLYLLGGGEVLLLGV
jgi:hypothetical protein